MASNFLIDYQLWHDCSCIKSLAAEAHDDFYMWFPFQSHYRKSTHNLDDILAVGFDGWLIWGDSLIIHHSFAGTCMVTRCAIRSIIIRILLGHIKRPSFSSKLVSAEEKLSFQTLVLLRKLSSTEFVVVVNINQVFSAELFHINHS